MYQGKMANAVHRRYVGAEVDVGIKSLSTSGTLTQLVKIELLEGLNLMGYE
jgi:hypothetical protein